MEGRRGRENRVFGYWRRVMEKKKKKKKMEKRGFIRGYGAQAVGQVWVPQKVENIE